MSITTSVRSIDTPDSIPVKLLKKILSKFAADLSFLNVISKNPELVSHIAKDVNERYYLLLFKHNDEMVPYQDFIDDVHDKILAVISNIEFKDLPPETEAKHQRRYIAGLKGYAAEQVGKHFISTEMEKMISSGAHEVGGDPADEDDQPFMEEGEETMELAGRKKQVH